MLKNIAIILIFVCAASAVFAQEAINLNFSGEIYENTCDLNYSDNEKKCEVLENQFANAIERMKTEDRSIVQIQSYLLQQAETRSTFFAVNLKQLPEKKSLNLEINYK
ncbi:type 1 fimbrial protein [Acinetobacter bereziniae]|jgi:type 1 fimbria pilin|uniref:type 1 fimbrial protein n=1 Tax=Acinetobacter TaxID=469 RepID=UPI0004D7F0FC|nr:MULTISPECIES: type 1 fimbrial protein [Acinetobacter]KEC82454.1 hypothetical protein DT74_02725 [Acinetobacter sp. ETR1]MBJ9905295.1 type 1 fimbrial protein [Acinetobacter bereziniae]MCG7223036.1 type 1 fimbrial protein [Acinetobacter sp. AG3]MCU4352571.1 type 1 fimbrial protein [Acinetobacter ursingii]MCU4543660.1 type 1 fimbrial protein [Acinetobacter bereziniae]